MIISQIAVYILPLTVVSLLMFAVEISLVLIIKRHLDQQTGFQNVMLIQISEMLRQIDPGHVVLYALVYSTVLLVGRFIPVVLSLVLAFQLISLGFNWYILTQLKDAE